MTFLVGLIVEGRRPSLGERSFYYHAFAVITLGSPIAVGLLAGRPIREEEGETRSTSLSGFTRLIKRTAGDVGGYGLRPLRDKVGFSVFRED